MYEVEVKVRADHHAVRRRLSEVGANLRGTVRQEDVYYDAPHREFGQTDEALRLRRERRNGEWISSLTYKGPRVDDRSKTRQEAESEVTEPEAVAAILEGLGFEPAATVTKDRERYTLDGDVVALDDVDGLGTFVEVERQVDGDLDQHEAGDDGVTQGGTGGDGDPDIEIAVAGVHDTLRRLGLDPDDQIRTSYLGLLLDAQE